MSRLTITLSEASHKALKEAAVQRSKTIGQLIDESLAARPDLVLITGDKRLLQDAGMHSRVLSPRAFANGS